MVRKEIKVEIDQEKWKVSDSFDDFHRTSAFGRKNSNQSGGSIDYGEKSLTISTKLKMSSLDDIKNTPIQIADGSVLRLGDIANGNRS